MARMALLSACTWVLACLPPPGPAHAATLRAFRLLPGGSVHLSDLFDGMAAPDRVLGASPAPGGRILVQAPQLAAIARDYNIDWRPTSGSEQTILQRDGRPFGQAQLTTLLRPRLSTAGAAADTAIVLADYTPPLLPNDAAPQAAVDDFSYDPVTYRFSAQVTVSAADMPPVILRVTGQAVPVVEVAVLTQHLRAGAVLTPDDLRSVRLPATALHGVSGLLTASATGLALRRDMAAGQPIGFGDLVRPMLVARNANVRMVLTAGTLALSAEGTALEDGAMGAHIRVQNPTSHAVMLAEVSGADEVRIVPGHVAVQVAAQ